MTSAANEGRYRPVGPFEVGIFDKFHAFDDEGYDAVGTYDALGEAVAEADRITHESDGPDGQTAGSFGSVGLVYDARGKLIYTGERGYVLDIDGAAAG